jgi:UDP:flavonoid glycosyltransferase YjiC (YdhE family)
VPKLYDQYYWSHRVQQLGIGVGLSLENLTVSAITSALRECMQPAIAGGARSLANRIKLREAHGAAARLLEEFG